MQTIQQPAQMRSVKFIYHVNTKNVSFIKMFNTLKTMGVKNNKFHLVLYDAGLKDIDPHDPRLPMEYQIRVLSECKRNFWYFIREVVRVAEPGNPKGIRYGLHRGNLTMNYCLTRNLNVYIELPRQNFKSISAVAWYLWVYMFGTTNSQMMFSTKSKEFAKENLKRLKDMKELLPHYFQFKHYSETTGKELKNKESVESISNIDNKNSIVTMPSARSKTHADQLARGCTQPLQWYDEYAFIPYNEIVYASAAPAFSQASQSARRNNKPYSMLMTSTPGDMSSDMGRDAYMTITNSTKFDNVLFDMTQVEIEKYIEMNGKTPFVYIRFMYYDLGRDEEWFKRQCSILKYKWGDIKREVLLEWAKGSGDCPFSEEELEMIESHTKPPMRIIHINKYYPVAIYEEASLSEPPIIGCDVSGGYRRDASTFVQVSSRTTKVQAVFNNSKIGINEFSYLLKSYINQHAPTSVLVIERNSYGEGVISNLRKTDIAQNLYFQYAKDDSKDKMRDGFKVNQSTLTKEYGIYTTPKVRETIFDLLKDRVTYHPDKFVATIILDEMKGLIFDGKRGRIDHSPNTHDDTIMGLMMALYCYYYGTALQNFGVFKREIPRFGESIETMEDMRVHAIDPIFEAENSLKVNKILPKRYDVGKYKEWVVNANMELKDEIESRLQLKSLIGTGRVMNHIGSGSNSSDLFRTLNNLDRDVYQDERKDSNIIYDMSEDNFQEYYNSYSDESSYDAFNSKYEEQEEYIDPNDDKTRFNFLSYMGKDRRPINGRYN